MKKIISICLVFSMMVSMACVAYAHSPRYVAIGSFQLLGKVNSTSVSVEAAVTLNDSYDSETIISLERSSNGGPFKHYTTLATKSSSRTSYSVSTSKSNLSSSYDYRVKAEVYVYDENGRQIDYDYQYLN